MVVQRDGAATGLLLLLRILWLPPLLLLVVIVVMLLLLLLPGHVKLCSTWASDMCRQRQQQHQKSSSSSSVCTATTERSGHVGRRAPDGICSAGIQAIVAAATCTENPKCTTWPCRML
jgi:uncharacterized membrane protein YeiB